MEKETFLAAFREIPKAEIHLHLEDFLTGEAASEEKIESLTKFVCVFREVQDSLRSVEDLEVAFRNLTRYMNQNGVVYAEVFFSPGRYLRGGWMYENLVKFMECQLRSIRKTHNLVIKLLVDVSRSHGIEKSRAILLDIIEHPSKDVIGIGLGGDEEIGAAADYVDLFNMAREHNLRTVAHAGESANAQSIMDAVVLLKAERIGHGTSAMHCDKTIELLVSKQIPLEVQPTSNIITGKYVKSLDEHPIKKFYERGVFVTLNTDDPNLFNVSLVEEYWNIYNTLGFLYEDLYKIIVNGFLASFMPEAKKKDWIIRVNKKWNRQLKLSRRHYTDWQVDLKDFFTGRDY